MSRAASAEQESFHLSPQYRARLDELAREHYDCSRDNRDRARDIRESLMPGEQAAGYGSGRVVIPLPETAYTRGRHDSYVAKLPRQNPEENWSGLEQNKREAEVWSMTNNPLLVPVSDFDTEGYWLVMPKGEAVEHRRDKSFVEWKRDAEWNLDGLVWEDDIRAENAVKLAGNHRLCDYGISPEDEQSD